MQVNGQIHVPASLTPVQQTPPKIQYETLVHPIFCVEDKISAQWRRKRGGRGGKNYRGSGPDYVAYVFTFLGSIIICRLYKLTLPDQTKVSLSDLVYIIFAGPPFLKDS
jgi:hypothetical protein